MRWIERLAVRCRIGTAMANDELAGSDGELLAGECRRGPIEAFSG